MAKLKRLEIEDEERRIFSDRQKFAITLHDRIARALQWPVERTYQMSLPALRELVRPVSQQLADEITALIAKGSFISR